MNEQVEHISISLRHQSRWQDYVTLCKPKVVALILLTVIVGMHLATPHAVPLTLLLSAITGIGLLAAAAATINHLFDKKIDGLMSRTKHRPLANDRISTAQALTFASIMGTLGFIILLSINTLTALLTVATLLGYAGIYTVLLKRTTPQNIVIGGLAGAMPPLLGWTAVSGQFAPESLLLVLIIYTWTPPHFWALAIYRHQDYARATIPMLPVTHGIPYTKLNILLYTVLLFAVSSLPFVVGLSGWLYLTAATTLGFGFLYHATVLLLGKQNKQAMRTFQYSIFYLMFLFLFLMLDHYML